jgi:uncharacterized protein
MKTEFDSFCFNSLPEGCKLCVLGKKSVLFLGGKCSRKCWYCSLSHSRRKCEDIFLNERKIEYKEDLIKELKESNSKGVGITGGDPLFNFKKNIGLIKFLRDRMGNSFHMHIYLPLGLVNRSRIKILNKYVDEIRFHPSILIVNSTNIALEETNKIKMASKIFGIKKIGIEMPIIPDKKLKIYNFIKEISPFIGFVNLNEFEISETNLDDITQRYCLNTDTCTVFGSLVAGKEIISLAKKDKLDIKIHLCSAKTKDFHQYRNRLSRHNILPFGNKIPNGNVVYFIIYDNLEDNLNKIKKITKNFFYDRVRNRILIKMSDVLKVYENLEVKIAKVEEQPVFGNERVSLEWIGEQ